MRRIAYQVHDSRSVYNILYTPSWTRLQVSIEDPDIYATQTDTPIPMLMGSACVNLLQLTSTNLDGRSIYKERSS